jgi:hypothetical protein
MGKSAVRQVTGALAAGGLVLGLTSCGSTVGGSGASGVCSQAGQVTRLSVEHVRPSGPFSRGQRFEYPAGTVTDPAAARSVAEAVCGLPVMTSGAVACPVDTFLRYRLVFSVGARKLPPVSVDPAGCQIVRGLGKPRTVARSAGFWRALGNAER